MDTVDRLYEHNLCGLCGRRITNTDDFCTTCRRLVPVVVDDQLDLLDLVEP
jgi:predicted amidophosphoribosyltransferase